MSDFDPATFICTMSRMGHNGMLGFAYDAHGADWASLALPYREDLVGDRATGILAWGPIVALMDMASSVACWLKTDAFSPLATVDLRIDYLRPAEPGKTVIGRAECYRLTRRIAFVRGEAHDGDPAHPLAHVVGTYMFTNAA
jgi:uncharacterized protein (TIGR00369 family)